MFNFADLPTRIQSISKPSWTDTLHWVEHNGTAVADVDKDWRVWVRLDDGSAVVRHKGWITDDKFVISLAEALAVLDYRSLA